MTVEQDTLLSWRKTAISVKHIIASEYQGVTYTVSLSSFLAGGENNGSKWRIPLSECEGPFFMTMGDLYSQRRSNPRIEMKEKPRGKQTDLFDYE